MLLYQTTNASGDDASLSLGRDERGLILAREDGVSARVPARVIVAVMQRYARALDRLQPLLLNYRSGGLAWRKHGISAAQVRRINRSIQDGAPPLWEFAQRLIQNAETEGLLRSD